MRSNRPRVLSTRRSASRRRLARQLGMEFLERRLLLAEASAIVHSYREDDFSIAGTFTYRLHSPEDFDYIDTINNGQYTSSSGRVTWTSPTVGKGFFAGTATGDGRDTIEFAGRRTCSEYGIEDIGRFDFTVDAATSNLKIDRARADSTRYTYYRDLTGGHCEQPDPPWSRFFGGFSSNYVGMFSPATHQASFSYDDDSPDMQVVSPAATVNWTNTQPNDIAITARAVSGEPPTVPDGYIEIWQELDPPESLPYVDLRSGAVELTATLAGKPIKTSTPTAPVAQVRLYWASSQTDFNGAEIPIDTGGPVGLFWNSTSVTAKIENFPAAPASAKFIRVAVQGTAGLDGNPNNNSTFLPVGTFEARDTTSATIEENEDYDGTAQSVLHPLDASSGVRVLAYKPVSELGASVDLYDEMGGFIYSANSDAIDRLRAGETGFDRVYFLAMKDQTLLDEAVMTIPLRGVNDAPWGNDDEAATTNFQALMLPSLTLLSNDTDPDLFDPLRMTSVDETSNWGAEIRVVWNEAQTHIEQVLYDPSKSASLRGLATGEKIQDSFSYEITDSAGETGYGYVLVEVTGEERILRVNPVAPQFTVAGTATAAIQVDTEDSDADPEDVQLTVTAADTTLVPPEGIEVIKSGAQFWVTITPAAQLSGRTQIQLLATNNKGETATEQFLLTVGTETDLDLDGVDNADEDAGPNGGDMNLDGILDSQQGNVATLRIPSTDRFLSVAVPAEQILVDVSTRSAPAPAGAAANATLPIGLLEFEVLAEASEATTTAVIRSDFTGTELNRVFGHDGQNWFSWMYNKRDGAKIFADRIEIQVRDGGRGDASTAAANIGFAVALGHVDHPWQNLSREDVDNDGVVAPIDVLLLINQINNFGPRALGKNATEQQPLTVFLDPSGNDNLEPIDALIVINFLNNRAAEGEGEAGIALASTTDSPSIVALRRDSSDWTEPVEAFWLDEQSIPRAGTAPCSAIDLLVDEDTDDFWESLEAVFADIATDAG